MNTRKEKDKADNLDNSEWSIVLTPRHGLFDINLREVYRYRDLIWLFVRRDFVSYYKQTILGPLWYVFAPLITSIVFTFIFGRLAKISTNGVPKEVFYFAGTMMWGYFSACLMSASDVFINNSNLFGKVYFPRLTVPISKVFSNLIAIGFQTIMLVLLYVYFLIIGEKIAPSWWIITIPLIVFQLSVLGTGVGLIVSSLATRYRDIRQLIGFVISMWMYATPIVYPLSQVPETYKWAMYVNPVSAPIELFRVAIFNAGNVPFSMLAMSLAITLVVGFLGLIFFSKNERSFIDVI